MLGIIEEIHQQGILHNDIKPDNFCLGATDDTKNQLYLVDFGIAKNYRIKGEHIPFKRRGEFGIGTARYASINAHIGIALSRRDDLESIGYVLLYLLKGDLPWVNIQAASDEERLTLIGKKKQETAIDDLCKGVPQAFHQYIQYCRNLEFT